MSMLAVVLSEGGRCAPRLTTKFLRHCGSELDRAIVHAIRTATFLDAAGAREGSADALVSLGARILIDLIRIGACRVGDRVNFRHARHASGRLSRLAADCLRAGRGNGPRGEIVPGVSTVMSPQPVHWIEPAAMDESARARLRAAGIALGARDLRAATTPEDVRLDLRRELEAVDQPTDLAALAHELAIGVASVPQSEPQMLKLVSRHLSGEVDLENQGESPAATTGDQVRVVELSKDTDGAALVGGKRFMNRETAKPFTAQAVTPHRFWAALIALARSQEAKLTRPNVSKLNKCLLGHKVTIEAPDAGEKEADAAPIRTRHDVRLVLAKGFDP